MAAITAAVTPLPVACAALATGASASAIYTRGLLSWSVDFDRRWDGCRRHANDCAGCSTPPTSLGIVRRCRLDAAVVSGCTRDGYVLQSETERLHRHWKGSALRWIEAGHFSALLTQGGRCAIAWKQAVGRL